MVYDISEKGLCVNHKVKIGNFTRGTSDKVLEKLDDIIKERLDNLIVDVRTNTITNDVSSMKFLRNSHRHLLHFYLSLTTKTKRTSR